MDHVSPDHKKGITNHGLFGSTRKVSSRFNRTKTHRKQGWPNLAFSVADRLCRAHILEKLLLSATACGAPLIHGCFCDRCSIDRAVDWDRLCR